MTNLKQIGNEARLLGCKVLENAPMSSYTSFKIGGPCDLLISPNSAKSLSKLLKLCGQSKIPFTLIGNGTNLLVSDKGIRGVVFRISEGFSELYLKNENTIVCGAGVSLSKLCHFALKHSLSGLEFAYGIPGFAGGAAFMNAGAYGGEMKDVLIKTQHIDRHGNLGELVGEQLDLSYRHSAYHENGCAIISLEIGLTKANQHDIKAKMDDLMSRRVSKQPLELPSCGSVFKRPEGCYAAALIEECGLKGYTIGGAQVSVKHSGFIVNIGGATCSDVLQLIEQIKTVVKNKTNIELECEVKVIGQ